MDLSKGRHFDLRLPVELVRVAGVPVREFAETTSLSSSEVFLITDYRIPIGEAVEYIITLVRSDGRGDGARLRCAGRVVRAPRWGTAVTLERYSFVRDTVAAQVAATAG